MLDKDWLLTCAPLGLLEEDGSSWKALGTGIFVYDDPVVWYVTAHHLINKVNGRVYILVEDTKTVRSLIDVKSLHSKHQIEWLIDEQNGLAATLFPASSDFIIKAIPFSLFIAQDELQPTLPCYSLGFPYSLIDSDAQKLFICALDGIISGINRKKNRIYVTAPSFPGNNGGGIFVNKRQINKSKDSGGKDPFTYFGGIITEQQLIQNGSGYPEVHSPQPIYLGVVAPAMSIQNLLMTKESDQMKRKIGKLLV